MVAPEADGGVVLALYSALFAQDDVGEAGDVGDAGVGARHQPALALRLREPEVFVYYPQELVPSALASLQVELVTEALLQPRRAQALGESVGEAEPAGDLPEGGGVALRVPISGGVVARGEVNQDGLSVGE